MQQNTIAIPGAIETAQQRFITKVYGWMCAALITTALVSYYTVTTPEVLRAIFGNQFLFFGLIIAEFAVVIILSAAINRLSGTAATALFFLYSALTGATLSVVVIAYTAESLTTTFLVTAGTFGAMSFYGYTTKRDLTSWGNLLFMGLLGIIVASIVNIFFASTLLYTVITYAGVLIFVGLTAYDTQKIKRMGASIEEGSETERKGAIIGALRLYLDFINLFLMLLRILGRRR
jgi:FtsH-binding integral membrane protein